jgi:hypothetical protein
VGKVLEQLRRTSFADTRSAIDNKIVLHADRIDSIGLEGEHNPLIPADVPKLLLMLQMSSHQLVSLEPYPNAGDLWTTVRAKRYQVAQPPSLDDGACG